MDIEEVLGFYLVATHVRVVKVFRGRDVVVVVHLLKCFIRYSESEEGRIGRWIEWRMHLSGICEYASKVWIVRNSERAKCHYL